MIYVVTGNDFHSIYQQERRIVSEYEETCCYYGFDADLSRLLVDLTGLPLFGVSRIVILRYADKLTSSSVKELVRVITSNYSKKKEIQTPSEEERVEGQYEKVKQIPNPRRVGSNTEIKQIPSLPMTGPNTERTGTAIPNTLLVNTYTDKERIDANNVEEKVLNTNTEERRIEVSINKENNTKELYPAQTQIPNPEQKPINTVDLLLTQGDTSSNIDPSLLKAIRRVEHDISELKIPRFTDDRVQKELDKQGIKVTPEAKRYLVRNIGRNGFLLESEINKLKLSV